MGGDWQPGRRGCMERKQLEVTRQRLADWMVPHLHADKPGKQLGSETDGATQGPSVGKENIKSSDCKTHGSCSSGKNSQSHRRVHWRDPQGPRTYRKPPTGESAPERPNLLVGSGGSD